MAALVASDVVALALEFCPNERSRELSVAIMGLCVGYIGWRVPRVLIGDPVMETLEPTEAEVIWPKPQVRRRLQRLVITGTRSDKDPAFLTCHGRCGKNDVKWTWHRMVSSASFQCNDCGHSRRWGLGFSY